MGSVKILSVAARGMRSTPAPRASVGRKVFLTWPGVMSTRIVWAATLGVNSAMVKNNIETGKAEAMLECSLARFIENREFIEGILSHRISKGTSPDSQGVDGE